MNKAITNEASKLLACFWEEDGNRDKNLSSYFVETSDYKKGRDRGSAVFIGRYGDGKSAILNRLVDDQPDETFVVQIELYTNQLFEELTSISQGDDFSTICESLVYLNLIYEIANTKKGKFANINQSILIDEMKSLELAPYGDLISRIADHAINFGNRISKIEFFKTLGIEIKNEQEEIDIRRYRSMNMKISTIITDMFKDTCLFVTIDSIQANVFSFDKVSIFVEHLINWCFKSNGLNLKQRIYISLPDKIMKKVRSNGGHISAQGKLITIEWNKKQLNDMVYMRVAQALKIDLTEAEEKLTVEYKVDMTKVNEVTFNRPRDYIKFFNKYFSAFHYDECTDVEKAWNLALYDYCKEVVDNLEPEWALCYSDFDILKDMLVEIQDISKTDLDKIIEEYRDNGFLKDLSNRQVFKILLEWDFIYKNSSNNYSCHGVFVNN